MNLHEQLALFTSQFHWLRPWWLLSLIPVMIIGILLWQQKRRGHQWQNLIAPELLPYLMDAKTITVKKSLVWGLIVAWVISALALAGPSWIKRPIPVEKNQNALVILLDLSISMISEDIKPSRIVRARLKIADIMRERKDGQTALVVYAGEAHTVTPMSDDSATIVSLLPSLQPNIMPMQGSNTEAAIQRGIELLHDAGASRGDLLLITDGVVPEAFPKIRQLLANKNIRLNILGVGSNQPAPIISGNGGFLQDQRGEIITTQLNSSELRELAQQLSGRYSDIANTNSDIQLLLTQDARLENTETLKRDFDQWYDQGYWLVFLLLPIALWSFRRGLILTIMCFPLLGLSPNTAYAFSLEDLWLTKDQQAQRTLQKGDAKAAAEQFKSPDWKAAAQYRAGDYAAAAESFAKLDTASAHYNRGNALAKLGKLEDAIKAYDEALKRDANLNDAKKNRELVEALLNQKKEEQKQKEQQQSEQNKQDQDQDQQNQGQQDSSQQNSSQQNQEQQGQDSQKQPENQQQQSSQQSNQEQTNQEQSNQDQNASQSSSQAPGQDSQAGQSSSSDNHQQSSSAANGSQSANNGEQQSSSASSANGEPAQNNGETEKNNGENVQPAEELDPNKLTEEQKQALEQWLRRVPDDPGGLLRNKFRYQYQQNRLKKAEGDFVPPENNADQRW